ncbi:MAG: PHP domain-containing protein [Candidatus Heimdallarchaeota archaeon]|nr:PHP domain-containing protein [Candidatus Heimdallarchaeota archaeon]MCK5049317.1 PHP domain-containing protein [Candidatus Heimdallarchaeota archaeon]
MDGYWKADLHIHSTYSLCSSAPLRDIVTFAGDQLNLFSISDHDLPSPRSPYLSENYLAQFYDVKFINGMEITTQEGHLLVYNFRGDVPMYQSVHSIINQLKGKDVILIAPHPFRSTGLGELVYDLPIDAIEINAVSPKDQNQRAIQVAEEKKIALVGGSDAHDTNRIAKCHFLYSKKYPLGYKGLKAAISDRATYPKWRIR